MTPPNDVPIPNLVRDALRLDGAYDFGLGVVLRATSNPRATGASASYRIEYRVEPALPGRPLARRKETYARDLAKAYAKAEAKFAEMKERASGTYTCQLNMLGLDPDDVAKFLGHRSGVQVWEMYVRVRPQLFGRAADASCEAGDPRTSRHG